MKLSTISLSLAFSAKRILMAGAFPSAVEYYLEKPSIVNFRSFAFDTRRKARRHLDVLDGTNGTFFNGTTINLTNDMDIAVWRSNLVCLRPKLMYYCSVSREYNAWRTKFVSLCSTPTLPYASLADFTVELDTGSSDLWIMPNSTSLTLTNATSMQLNISYLEGNVSGVIDYAMLEIGSYEIPWQGMHL